MSLERMFSLGIAYVLHQAVFWMSIAIGIMMMVPIWFKAEPTHWAIYQNQTEAGINSLAKWMKVDQFGNYFYANPNPNIKVTDEEMCRFWYLPPSTRFSASMQQLARCRIALDRLNTKDEKWDPTLCNRVGIAWPLLVLAIVIFQLVQMPGGRVGEVWQLWRENWPPPRRNISNLVAAYRLLDKERKWFKWSTLPWYFPWAILAAARSKIALDLNYTPRDGIVPIDYYPNVPRIWSIAADMCMINLSLKMGEAVACMVAAFKIGNWFCKIGIAQKSRSLCGRKDRETEKPKWTSQA